MNVSEIPADEAVEMTKTMHRAFSTAGCRPTCHACESDLSVGTRFKLATIAGHERKRHDFVFEGINYKTDNARFLRCVCFAGYLKWQGFPKLGTLGLCPLCGVVWEARTQRVTSEIAFSEMVGKLTALWGWKDHDRVGWANLPENNQTQTTEVMLCNTGCTPDDIPVHEKFAGIIGAGCFRVNGKIVLEPEI